jgi:hypothetical protein
MLFGVSSANCLKAEEGKTPHFVPSIDGTTGAVSIEYDGGDDSCLDFEKQKAVMRSGEVASISLKDLTTTSLTGTFDTLRLVARAEFSDRAPDISSGEELLDAKGEKISSLSAADKKLAEQKKKNEEKEKQALAQGIRADFYELVLAQCSKAGVGVNSLDLAEGAVKELSKIASFVEGQDADWEEKQHAALNQRRFEAAKRLLERGKVAAFGEATDILDRLVMDDPETYERKIQALYYGAIERLASPGASSSALAPGEILELADPLLQKLREFATDEKDDAKIAQLEFSLNVNQLDRASKMGADSEVFTEMSEKFRDYMVKANPEGCVVAYEQSAQFGQLVQAQSNHPGCATARAAQLQLNLKTNTAVAITQKINAEKQFLAQVEACRMNESAGVKSDACTKTLETYANRGNAAANQGLNVNGNGFGTTTTAATADYRNPAGSTSGSANESGLLNTGVNQQTPPTSAQNPVPVAQPQTVQPTVNVAPPQPTRVFRR